LDARASEVDEQLGQLDLCGSDGKLVWRNVHFYEAEIEFARLFLLLALLILLRLAVSSREGREIEAARSDGGKGIAIDIEPPATAGKKRRRGPSHEYEMVMRAARKLWPYTDGNMPPKEVRTPDAVNAVFGEWKDEKPPLPHIDTVKVHLGRRVRKARKGKKG